MKVLLVNHFHLETVCGTSVMFRDLLSLAPKAAPSMALAYLSYEHLVSTEDLLETLNRLHVDAALIVAVNAQIEVSWPLTAALFAWARDREIPACVYAHDYWPQHRAAMETLIERGGQLLASTPSLEAQLADAGYSSRLLQVGVPLPHVKPPATKPLSPKTLATAGRLVARKRLADIPAAFAISGLNGAARLYMRLLPSQVFDESLDARELHKIKHEITRNNLDCVDLDLQAHDEPPAYGTFAGYVCSSFYEGFSMPVIEAAFHGCPPIMSDISPHRTIASALFGAESAMFLFPVGDREALAALLRDEIETGRRRALIESQLSRLQDIIIEHWALDNLARRLEAYSLTLAATRKPV